MPEVCILARYRTAVRMLLQTEDGLFKVPVPFQGDVGAFGVDLP